MRRLKWWLLEKVHPLVHRTADKPCWVCNLEWSDLRRALQPFVDDLRQARADLEAGRGTPWRAVR